MRFSNDEDQKLAEEFIDLLGGFAVVKLAKKVSREIDVNGLCWLYLQHGMTKAEAGADGKNKKTTPTTADGEMMALRAAGSRCCAEGALPGVWRFIFCPFGEYGCGTDVIARKEVRAGKTESKPGSNEDLRIDVHDP